ncbi:uncharacterized protein LOC106881396 [Octopus bimaculoides]|nr:uncharacterized protein LOC106881396 [Octopus bimaculoides]
MSNHRNGLLLTESYVSGELACGTVSRNSQLNNHHMTTHGENSKDQHYSNSHAKNTVNGDKTAGSSCNSFRVSETKTTAAAAAETTATTSTRTKLGYSRKMSLYHRNPKLQANHKTVLSRKIDRKKKSKLQKMRKRLTKLLHTHAALIMLSFLVVMDATCVIGQLLADIFIVKEKLDRTETEKHDLAEVLQTMFPHFFNATDNLTLDQVLGHLKNTLEINDVRNSSHYSQKTPDSNGSDATHSPTLIMGIPHHNINATVLKEKQELLLDMWKQLSKSLKDHENILKLIKTSQIMLRRFSPSSNQSIIKDKSKKYSSNHFSRQSGGSEEVDTLEEEHNVLFEVTHVFHLTSITILSILLFETLLKVFAMGRKLLNHKIEVFDAAVIVISWSLDVAFKDGIWDHPGSNAATILIILLPWRVIRIVNSFVLVIQEKDHVRLKLIKQRFRSSERRTREYKEKLNKYRVSSYRRGTRYLNSLGFKGPQIFNALQQKLRNLLNVDIDAFKKELDILLSTKPDEPTNRHETDGMKSFSDHNFGLNAYRNLGPDEDTQDPIDEKRKRSSLALKALSEFASLAMVSTVGSLPNLASKSEFSSDSSSSDDDDDSSDQHKGIDRSVSTDSAFSQTDSLFSTVSYQSDTPNNNIRNNLTYSHQTLGDSSSLPTYEDAMTSVYKSDDIQSKNQHTKL